MNSFTLGFHVTSGKKLQKAWWTEETEMGVYIPLTPA